MGLFRRVKKLLLPDAYTVEEDGAVRRNGTFVGFDRER